MGSFLGATTTPGNGWAWLGELARFRAVSCLTLSAVLFAIGAWGILARRNLLIMLLSVEVMLNAVNLAFITFARCHAGAAAAGNGTFAGETGQVFALFVIAAAAAEAAVGLAILLVSFRRRPTVDSRELTLLQR